MDNQFLIDLQKEDIQDHPLATLFPEMETEEYCKFLKDIRENGQNEPVIVLAENGSRFILDGRHRARASRETGIPLKAKLFDGDCPLTFVVSQNMHRRHMTPSQRAMVAAKILNDPRYGIREAAEERQREGGEKGRESRHSGPGSDDPEPTRPELRARDQAAALVGASGPSTERAVYVMKHGTESDIEDVLTGKSTVTGKKKEIQDRESLNATRPLNRVQDRPRRLIPKKVPSANWQDRPEKQMVDLLIDVASLVSRCAREDSLLDFSVFPDEKVIQQMVLALESISQRAPAIVSAARNYCLEKAHENKMKRIAK